MKEQSPVIYMAELHCHLTKCMSTCRARKEWQRRTQLGVLVVVQK